MNAKTFRVLELDKILDMLKDEAASVPLERQELLSLKSIKAMERTNRIPFFLGMQTTLQCTKKLKM